MDPDEMRKKFDETVAAILSQKREDNKAFLSADEYRCRLQQLKRSKIVLRTAGQKKSMRDYRLVRKYDVLTVDGCERLVKPPGAADRRPLFYVTNEELFDVLHKTHRDIDHRGRNRMVAELKNNYCNVTKESVMTYLKLCARCRGRRNPVAFGDRRERPHPSPPLPSPPPPPPPLTPLPPPLPPTPYCGSRASVELIDMQARVYGGFRYIMEHWDHATKFVHLVPLKSTRPEEVACRLLDIYAAFGVPAVLESHCGSEFVDSVIEYIRSTWDRPAIVYAQPEYGRDQTVDAHGRIRKMLDAWTRRRHSDNWPLALKFLQLQKNCRVHPAIGMSPYQAMFGYPASGDWLSSDFAYDENDAFMAPDKSEDPADDDDDDAQETHCGRYPDGEEERGGKYRPPPYSFAVKTESA